jgi:hypothetical protein
LRCQVILRQGLALGDDIEKIIGGRSNVGGGTPCTATICRSTDNAIVLDWFLPSPFSTGGEPAVRFPVRQLFRIVAKVANANSLCKHTVRKIKDKTKFRIEMLNR